MADHLAVDEILAGGGLVTALANRDQLSIPAGMIEHLAAHNAS